MSNVQENNVSNTQVDLQLQGHIDSWNGQVICGWCVTSNENGAGLYFDKVFQNNVECGIYRIDLIEAGISESGKAGFMFELNYNKLRAKGVREISIGNGQGHLIGSPILIKEPNIRGFVDQIKDDTIVGWGYDIAYPAASLFIDIYVNDKLAGTTAADHYRKDLEDAGLDVSNCGFYFNIKPYLDSQKINVISFKLHGTNIGLFSEQVIQTKSSKTNSLIRLQNMLKREVINQKDNDFNWINKSLIPSLIDSLRAGKYDFPGATIDDVFSTKARPGKTNIIIPVYKGYDETINCIRSVFNVKSEAIFDVTVINDYSPEPELTFALRELKNELPFTLLENEKNLGFVQTVNKGMEYNTDSDVVLLNSDTIVTDNWLDRVVDVAYSDSTIGTVTPFSNNATICSYPRFCADNELPAGVDLEELSTVVSENVGIVDLPTAHGFAMFIKRQALQEVGLFDDKKWGKGYAEENDFSLRAARLGWRNVMATNAFVQHLGSVSFAEDSSAFIAKNLAKLNGIYPDYSQSVESFIKLDPIRPYRNNIAISLMSKEVEKQAQFVDEYQGSYVFVSLTIGGGTEVATNDLSKIHLDNHRCVFMLVCSKPNVWELKSQTDNSVAQYHLPQDRQELLDALQALSVTKFHIHHTLEFDKSIWDLPKDLGVTYDVTLHDYYTICPRVNLVDDTDFYCGEPGEEACNRCIKRNDVHAASYLKFYEFGNDIRNWRSFFKEKLSQAEAVITPSFDTKDRINKYFNLSNIKAEYHPEPKVDYKPKPLKGVKVINVGFLGAIGIHKGLNVLKECAEYSYKFNLPVKFTVIGYTANDEYFTDLPNVTITGKYKKEQLKELIDLHDIHVAALLSVWPETYSYTLSESLRNNLHVLSLDLGAVPERLDSAVVTSSDARSIMQEVLKLRGEL